MRPARILRGAALAAASPRSLGLCRRGHAPEALGACPPRSAAWRRVSGGRPWGVPGDAADPSSGDPGGTEARQSGGGAAELGGDTRIGGDPSTGGDPSGSGVAEGEGAAEGAEVGAGEGGERDTPEAPARDPPEVRSLSDPDLLEVLRLRAKLRASQPYEPFRVAGVSFEGRQEIVRELSPGDPLLFAREPDNPYDPDAVAVLTPSGRAVGYVPRTLTGPFLRDGGAALGHVVSVGPAGAGKPASREGVGVGTGDAPAPPARPPSPTHEGAPWGLVAAAQPRVRAALPSVLPSPLAALADPLAVEGGERCELCGAEGARAAVPVWFAREQDRTLVLEGVLGCSLAAAAAFRAPAGDGEGDGEVRGSGAASGSGDGDTAASAAAALTSRAWQAGRVAALNGWTLAQAVTCVEAAAAEGERLTQLGPWRVQRAALEAVGLGGANLPEGLEAF